MWLVQTSLINVSKDANQSKSFCSCFSVRFSSLVKDVVEVVQIRKVVKVMVVRRGASLVKSL